MIVLLAVTQVMLWHAYRGAEEHALRTLVQRFNAEQSEYRVETLALPYDAFAAKLTSAIAAAESAIGLAILVLLFRNIGSIDVEDMDHLKG